VKDKNNTNGKAFKILLVFVKYEFYYRFKSQRRRAAAEAIRLGLNVLPVFDTHG